MILRWFRQKAIGFYFSLATLALMVLGLVGYIIFNGQTNNHYYALGPILVLAIASLLYLTLLFVPIARDAAHYLLAYPSSRSLSYCSSIYFIIVASLTLPIVSQ